ncbi:MAG: hypothetical protein AB8B69_14200 [Chitinophagales bacterium]
MRGAYTILGIIIVLVLLGVFAIQSSKTKAYTSNQGAHPSEVAPSSEVYSKYDFKPQQVAPALLDSLPLEAGE